MKKLLLLFLLLTLSGCSEDIQIQDNKELWVKEELESMSLEEKIGQMLIVSFDNLENDEELLDRFKEVKPGVFILFSDNFESYSQTKKLINDINSTSDIPMFVSIDQEGGRVQRLKELDDQTVSVIPAMYELGLTNDINLAYEVGRVMGEELRDFNINMDFAPVLDIYSNSENTVIGDRSFGNNPELVTNMALSFSKGLESTDIIPVYKHFPGHGDTYEDSHQELAIIDKTKEELYELELIPFIEAINRGANVIMVGHLALPNITGNYIPASLSKEIINDLLREELGFKGIVVTDALNMKALTNEYSKEEIYILAIKAGVNILLMPDFDKTTIDIISKAVLTGVISEELINESVEKILTLKYDKVFVNNSYTKDYLGSLEHDSVIKKIKK